MDFDFFSLEPFEPGALLILLAEPETIAAAILSRIRLQLGERLGRIDRSEDRFLWVVLWAIGLCCAPPRVVFTQASADSGASRPDQAGARGHSSHSTSQGG